MLEVHFTFLQAVTRFCQDGHEIVHSDETYIHSFHTTNMPWSDDTPLGDMAPTSKGQWLIIVHAGIENGFIPGALVLFKSNQKTGHCHKEMNSDNYVITQRHIQIG
jgi:hypothetical protein